MAKLKTRRTFTREFKLQAVKLITEQSYSYAEAARKLGVRGNLLRRWKEQFAAQGENAFPGLGVSSVADDEVTRLRAENKRLLMECEFLKKAAAFFARESLGSTPSFGNTRPTSRCDSCARRSKYRRRGTTLRSIVRRAKRPSDARLWAKRFRRFTRPIGVVMDRLGCTRNFSMTTKPVASTRWPRS